MTLSIKTYSENYLNSIINNKKIGYKSLSNNTYYIKLNDETLLLMQNTPENTNVLNNYSLISYNLVPDYKSNDKRLLYWWNFPSANNQGFLDKGASLLKSERIKSNYYEIENYAGTWDTRLYEEIKTTVDISITQCVWIEGKVWEFGLMTYGWTKSFLCQTHNNPPTVNMNGGASPDNLELSDIADFEVDKLYFIVIQYDGNNNKLLFYRKSEEINDYKESNLSGDHKTIFFDGADCAFYVCNKSGGAELSQKLYDIKIYNQLLTADEIESLYNESKFTDKYLLYWFNFQNSNSKNLGYLDKGLTITRSELITDNYYELGTYTGINNHSLHGSVKTTNDVHITQCFWIKGKDWTGGLVVDGYDKKFGFAARSPPQIELTVSASDTFTQFPGVSDFESDKIYFVVVQYDGINKKVKFYRKSDSIDDYREYDDTVDHSAAFFDGVDWFLYAYVATGTERNRLYDIKIYNKLLTSDEIEKLYNDGYVDVNNNNNLTSKIKGEDPTLLYWLNFQGGNDKNLGSINKDYEIWSSEKYNIKNNHFQIEHHIHSVHHKFFTMDKLTNEHSITMCFWVRCSDFLIGLKNGDDNWSRGFRINHQDLMLEDSNSGNDIFTITSTFEAEILCFITLQYDGNNNKMYFYKKSAKDDVFEEFVCANEHSYLFNEGVSWLLIASTYKERAQLYDFKVYNRVLTSTEITALYKEGYQIGLSYWLNFQNNNYMNLGYQDKGKNILHLQNINNNACNFMNFHSPYHSAAIYMPMHFQAPYITLCAWIEVIQHDSSFSSIGLARTVYDNQFYNKYLLYRFNSDHNNRCEIYCESITQIMHNLPILELNKLYFIIIQYDGEIGKISFQNKTLNYCREVYIDDKDTCKDKMFNGDYFSAWNEVRNDDDGIVKLYDLKLYNSILYPQQIDQLYSQGIKTHQLQFGDNKTLNEVYDKTINLEEIGTYIYQKKNTIDDNNNQSDNFPEWRKITNDGNYTSVFMNIKDNRLEVVQSGTPRHVSLDGTQGSWGYSPPNNNIYTESRDNNDTFIILTLDYKIFRLVRPTNIWTDISDGMNFISVTLGDDGELFAVGTDHKLYQRNATDDGWTYHSESLVQISVANINNMCGIGNDYNLYYYNGGWRLIPINEIGAGNNIVQASIGKDGIIYVVFDDNTLRKYVHGEWSFERSNVKMVHYNPPYLAILNTSGNIEVKYIIREKSYFWRVLSDYGGFQCVHMTDHGRVEVIRNNTGGAFTNDTYSHHNYGSGKQYIQFERPYVGKTLGVLTTNLIDYHNGDVINNEDKLFKWVSIGTDDEIWAISTDDKVYKYNGNGWDLQPGGLMQISVANANNICGVNDVSQKLYIWENGNWTHIRGRPVINACIGGDGVIYAVLSTNELYKYYDNQWTHIINGIKQVSYNSKTGNIAVLNVYDDVEWYEPIVS